MKALIYCRVSSERQVSEGHGNESQEQRCQNRAKEKGYQVEKTFKDDGVSGALFERPAMKALISYIDAHVADQFVVIFDDLSRFARDMKVHLQLKTEFGSRGVKLECLNFTFDDTPESEFVEMVLASSNQYQRQQNRRQVIQKQKARIESGYWAFCPPKGMKYVKDPVHGKLLVSDEPYAGIYKRAIEGYLAGLFLVLAEVRSFINDEANKIGIEYKVSIDGVKRILTEILYTGYVEYQPWEITRRKGHHSGFISLETYDKVQDILAGKSKPRLRKDYNQDFPLRGLVNCAECGQPYTASWNKGRSKRYPNYFCKTNTCQMRYKTVAKVRLEEDFTTLLSEVTLSQQMADLARNVILDVWKQKKETSEADQQSIERQVTDLDIQLEKLVIMATKAASGAIVSSYEKEMAKLHAQREELISHMGDDVYTIEQFGTAAKQIMTTLTQPLNIWKSDDYQDKRTITHMYFKGKLTYRKGVGFGTAELDPNIALIRESSDSRTRLVEVAGIEPASEKVLLKHLQA